MISDELYKEVTGYSIPFFKYFHIKSILLEKILIWLDKNDESIEFDYDTGEILLINKSTGETGEFASIIEAAQWKLENRCI